MKKRIMLLISGILLLFNFSTSLKAEDKGLIEKIVSEIKTFNFSLGDYVYLIKEGQSYYGIGISKDVGQYVKRIGKDWLYADVGYLNTVGMSSQDKDWVYGGVSVNGGRLVACGIEWTTEQFGAKIEMPDFLKKNMMKVGYIAATKWDQNEFAKVWDTGPRVRIIEIKFGGVK